MTVCVMNHSCEMELPLDMANSSVDDQYSTCRREMSCLVNSTYLEREQENTTNFKEAWQHGEKFTICDNSGNNLARNHCIALHAYSLDNSEIQIFSAINNAARAGRENYTNYSYQWYSLHLLLTDAAHWKNHKCLATRYIVVQRASLNYYYFFFTKSRHATVPTSKSIPTSLSGKRY